MKKFLIALIVLIPSIVFAGTVTITFDANLKRADNTTMTMADINHFDVYWGNASGGPYPNKQQISNTGVNPISAIITLSTGTFFFVSTETDQYSQESGYSNQVTAFIAPAKPGAPVMWATPVVGVS